MATTLGEFLRARREATTPRPGCDGESRRRRRTPGLRREEVAARAGISPDYYARLEQGRETHPSVQVLEALVIALSLSPDEAGYLYDLAIPQHRRRQELGSQQGPVEYLLLLMQAWTLGPAYIVNRRCDVLAANPQASLLFSPFTITGNILRLLFLDPEAKNFWVNWESYAKTAVATVHRIVGVDVDHPDVAEIILELSKESSDFVRLWKSHDVGVTDGKVKQFRHRDFGDIEFDYELLSAASAPGQFLVIHWSRKNTASLSTGQPT
ncbi:helix-turn-helix transcriptional regulator [Mycobacterium helveticum]|uniref:Helix-turn-helix domain-containing protein n=1 Tax=Mycobacterium helveticum TaxID=2592811 RepID=A0A557XY72_9MYCO|nr:helix-turn-helix transcriptional regulator [Mycobacterium helveticum]TVS87178.1 helix-turn-helix domain-containing protein [Mycobacterium helveticum]TVS91114.1 helix-turn-helix domain-containing protein [Mycobacterium helveticum]